MYMYIQKQKLCVLECVLELYVIHYNTCRCFWLFESDCTQLCKYIHTFVKFGPEHGASNAGVGQWSGRLGDELACARDAAAAAGAGEAPAKDVDR